TARAGAAGGDLVRAAFELVGQRLEPRWGVGAEAVRERLREQPVREPRVAREQRPVEVGADHAAGAAALEAALPVVAEPGEDASERLGTGVEPRASRVVLEPGERAPLAGLELALEQHVADHAALSRDCLEREQPDAGHVLAVEA